MTQAHDYTVERFVFDFRVIATGSNDAKVMLKRIQPSVKTLAASDSLAVGSERTAIPHKGSGVQFFYEEPAHALALAVLSWLPGKGTPPHDHGTWGVVVGFEDDVVNVFWKRTDRGSQTGHA